MWVRLSHVRYGNAQWVLSHFLLFTASLQCNITTGDKSKFRHRDGVRIPVPIVLHCSVWGHIRQLVSVATPGKAASRI